MSDSNHSQTMTLIKLNRGNMKDFCICDSNHNFHLIRIMQHCDPNHKLHMIQITQTHLSLCLVWFESHLCMTRITPFLAFSYWALSNLIWIIVSTWLESWPFMLESQFLHDSNHMKMGHFFYVDLVPLYLFTLLKSTNILDSNQTTFFYLFLCLISNSYNFFSISYLS